MKLREFADMLTDREYGHEITKEEESLAKELGFVVVFGYSDDNAELRGAIDDEIGCFDGGVLEHKDLQGTILAEWCPEDIDCSWHFSSTQPSEKFYIYEGEELYCVGIVIDNNKTKPKTNADRIRAMSDEELAKYIEEVEKRVCEEMKRREEMIWRDEREREQDRIMRDLELRLIAVEKKNGIDHPSHKCMEAVRAGY